MKAVLTGNQAIARGFYEAGGLIAASYPGSPTVEIMETLKEYDEIYAEFATNEKVALEVAIGGSLYGARSMASMKHVGVNIAMDPLMSFTQSPINGGFVLVTGDDPGMASSQNEQDNRIIGKFANMGIFYPGTSQEAKDFMKTALELSEKFKTPMMVDITSRVCHSRGIVELGDREEVKPKGFTRDQEKYTMLPPHNFKAQHFMKERIKDLEEYAYDASFNILEEVEGSDTLIVTSGLMYYNLKELNLSVSIYKLGMVYPISIRRMRELSHKYKNIIVIEEMMPFIENELKLMGIDCKGKEYFSFTGELFTEDIEEGLHRAGIVKDRKYADIKPVNTVNRPPMFCAGCPHRGFFYELGRRKNVMITGDIGCYTLGGADPLNAMDTTICMGASISVGHGAKKVLDRYNKNMRVVSVIGDSTFFHTGINSLMDVVYNKSNIITCILDNRVTGMTGHQDNPGTGYTLQGEMTEMVDIPSIVRALGIKHVRTVNPLKINELKEAFDWAFELNEPSVIITRYPCALKKLSEFDKKEFEPLKGKCEIDSNKCIGCKRCVNTGCPAIQFIKSERKSRIDKVQCVGCNLCVQVCPVNAISKVGE